jgi:flagellar hook-basal body complex protein FliE
MDVNRLMAMRSAILEQNGALQKAAGLGSGAGVGDAGGTGAASGSFGDALKTALDQVNDLQSKSSEISAAYEKGETTDIAAVMLARQQASIGFEATLQVRNRLLSAYKDIMNMPV